ncbi:hypothetical protein BASA81_011413 [Batrachochytrium salamandrivorans]|nr:hypothetical protein BASA81_011413 [Batrachochytrium salamandrivorans]
MTATSTSCALRGEAILAESAYLQMVEAGHIANIKTYASMITAHGIAEDAFKAQSWFEKYTESSEPPSITPFVAFAQSLVLGDRVPAAIDVLTRLLPSAISSVDIWPINDLMALFERRLDYDSMQLLYDTISRDSTLPQPNFKTFLYMMSASLIKGNLNESLGYYSRIESKHMSSYQIGLLGCACADAGDCDLSLSLANEQLRRSLLPESSHVAKLIDLLYKADKTGVRALSFLKRVISEFVKRKQDKFATSPTVDYGLNALVTQCEDNLRCALDVFAYAEKTRVRLSRYFATRVCSSFRKADPETISGLSTTDYAAIFDCTFAQYNRDSHLSSVGLVRASIRRLLSSMLASNLVPTVQIDEIRDTQKKPVFFFKEWHKPAPVIRQTIQDQESRTLLSKLEVHCAASEIKEAMEVYEQISESGKVIPFQTLQSLMRLVSKDENTNNVVHVMRTAIANAEQSKDMIIRTRAPLAAYESAIQALLTRRHTLLASKLVEEVISKFNKIPSSHICIMLFQNFNSSVSINLTDARRLDHIFTSYIKDKSLINIPLHVFECMFRVYRITKDLEKAKSLEKLMQDNKLRIGTSSYANLVAIFVENDCTANALGAFDHYLDSTPTPSMAVFNTMMKMHINHARDIKSALDIWHVSRQLNVMPDSDSLRWLLAGLTDLSKDPVSAEKLFDALTLPASHPGSTGLCLPCTSVHYDILLNGYAHMDVPDSDRMIELYDRMIAQKISPTLMTFENVISGLCRGKDASTRIAEQFRDRMATYRLVPTPAIYNSIMKLYFDLNDAAGASRVFEELARNLDPNYAPDLQSYEIMIKGLVGVGQRERAAGFLDRARRHGGYPKTRVDELEKLLLK